MADVENPKREEPKETLLITCGECAARVSATIEGGYEEYHDLPGYTVRFSLLRCPECVSPILVSQDDEVARDAYNHDQDDDLPRWGRLSRMFPEAAQRQLGPAVPEPIRTAFDEAIACFEDARAYTACAIMCRKVLEGICDSQGAKGGNLAKRLTDLFERGELDKRLYEWVDMLRMVGNEAAHDVKETVSQSDAADLLDFAEAVAEYQFTFRDKFQEFKTRRESREKKKAESK